MTTFNRTDCARINQEIIKLNYSAPLQIVHACSSPDYGIHLEDVLVACSPPKAQDQDTSIQTLQRGALDLLKRSLAGAIEKFAPEYIIHLEGDTWIMDEQVIWNIISRMERNRELIICTSAWDEDQVAFKHLKHRTLSTWLHLRAAGIFRKLGRPYRLTCRDSLATQFFVIKTTPELLEVIDALEPIPGLDLEQAFYRAFMARFGEKNILRQSVREPIHPFNRFVCEGLSLFSQHWPARGTANDGRDPTHPRYIAPTVDGKKETLLRFTSIRRGEHLQRLLNADTFDYYNAGASRT